MAARGVKPTGKQTLFRGEAMTDWTEVENIPFEDAPELPGRAPRVVIDKESGAPISIPGEWSKEAQRKWSVWSSMPHCKLWMASDWEYAFDCLEVFASFSESGGPGLATELRNREKLLGTTAEYRRDLRIRYVEPKQEKPNLTVVRDDFTDL
ncbi:phage terminase small subunit [Mycolicibacterium septicum]|uniref:phage terminase small subunit n=1 Tax=Mycolicibacterium septicum TaxID=98668 RepID=UPI001AF15674|nr:hypothetical protein [Mycolicibacterium septicum]QRY51739.1 hypothetical protein JVX95_30935 [Mycolicibacterium septicum]